ncbi:hypothetical protein D3C72_1545060 [compost metagenome]
MFFTTLAASAERFVASPVWAAVFFTVAVICSIEAAVCSTELACSSVRAARSWFPATICAAALEIFSEPDCTCCTISSKRVFISIRACSSKPVSSFVRVVMLRVKSPSAMASANATASPSGRVMDRTMNQPIVLPISTLNAVRITSSKRLVLKSPSTCFPALCISLFCTAISSCTLAL